MPLLQAEADALLQMTKEFVDDDPIEFHRNQPMNADRLLRSVDRREEFILDIERGNRKRIRLKFQTRARKVIVLARFELSGPPHKNPPNSPYRPGEWLSESHLHLYKEGFEDRIAYELADVPSLGISEVLADNPGVEYLEHFMKFCGIKSWPPIQMVLL